MPGDLARAGGIAVGGLPWPYGGHGRPAARPRTGTLGHAQRPLPPAAKQLAELDRGLLAHEHVQLVAGFHDGRAARRDGALPAHHHVEQRLARKAELAHGAPDDGVAAAYRELDR